MRRIFYYLLLSVICLCSCLTAWAQPEQSHDNLQIQITGLPAIPLANAYKILTAKKKLIPKNASSAVIRRFYRAIAHDIKEAIAPYGYFKARIRVTIRRQGALWQGRAAVNPGPRMKFTTLDLRITGPGSQHRVFQHLYTHFPLQAGQNFNSSRYEDAKLKLFNTAAKYGYFRAKMLENAVYVNLITYQSRVVIHFATGPRYYFGATTFTGTPFNEKFMRRFLRYHQGHHYRHGEIRRTRAGLANSNYFQQVIVTPQLAQAQHLQIPIKVTLTPQPKKQYTFGLGYGTDTGVRALVGLNYRWVNQWGHRFSTYARGSARNSEAVASYYIPGHNPVNDQYILTGGYLNQNFVTGNGQGGRLSFIYQTQVLGWQQSIALTFLREKYNLTNFPRTDTSLVYPTYTLQRIRSDDPLRPRSGYSIVARVLGANDHLLSRTSFWQTRLDMKFLFTLFNTTRFLTRGAIGHTSINDLVRLPLSLQFFAGGAQSIRGFSYNSIGPGKNMFIGSVEIQQKLKGNFYVAAFTDFGSVSNDLFGAKISAGIGPAIVWLSPIGAFELSVANAISQSNRPWVIQFSIGPAL